MSPMPCRVAHEVITALVDGEPITSDQQAALAHVATCPACAERLRDHRRISEQIKALGRPPVPKGLEERLRAQLAAEAEAANDNESFDWQHLGRRVAAIALVAGLSGFLGWSLSQSAARRAGLEHDVVAAHARSLLQEASVQIASSESHTVKPWFNGRVDFAPRVRDLSAEGFPLIGGRLDYIGGRRAAALVYKRRAHLINVFIWPSASGDGPGPVASGMQGYSVLSWTADGLTYWAVSDLNAKELSQLQALL